MKIKSITTISNEDVYDITVEDNHNFFANGVLVHNCGEQGLPPNGSCLLGSLNLTKFVVNPFTKDAYFDHKKYAEIIEIAARMLDNVVELNGLPLEAQRIEITTKRRHGMGYYGLGSAMVMLGIKYGSEESLSFTTSVTRRLALSNLKAGIDLAIEKGEAPVLTQIHYLNQAAVDRNENARQKHLKEGDKILGRDLWLLSHSFDVFASDPEGSILLEEAAKYGCRYTHSTSIAPTGTISLSIGNNASNGIEPSFSHHYKRNRIIPGKATKEQSDVFSYELLAYMQMLHEQNPDQPIELEKVMANLPESFVSSNDLTGKQHIDVQAAAQVWIDSSISKTINVPTETSFDDFKELYLYSYDSGLKGTSTFRFNPAAFSGVLVNAKDLENTTYVFKLANGKEVIAKGNDTIMYKGESHNASNLFDAIKENKFGKY